MSILFASDDEVEDVTKQTEEDVSMNSEEDTGELTASSEHDIEKKYQGNRPAISAPRP